MVIKEYMCSIVIFIDKTVEISRMKATRKELDIPIESIGEEDIKRLELKQMIVGIIKITEIWMK